MSSIFIYGVIIILFFESFQVVFYLTLYKADIMDTKLGLGIAVASIVIAVAMLAPLATNADAAKRQVCSSGPTEGTGPCPGNSGSNGNDSRCEVTRTGQGGGQGTIKDTSC
jgi:hypothetical protein